ncbi:MAG: NADH-quinone oxidoreductase subunit J [Verrucomicrobiota bacterium]
MTPIPGSEYILAVIFLLAVLTTVIGALIAALSVRIIRSVCGLALCCLGLAGLFYFLNSPFLAMMEILIYIGAVCVTIVFAIMMSEPDEALHDERPSSAILWIGFSLLVCGAVFWALSRLPASANLMAPTKHVTDGSVQAIGRSLLTTYSLAFELISVALLVAILGALAIARTGKTKP